MIVQGEGNQTFPDFPIGRLTRKGMTLKSARGHSYRAVEDGLQLLASGLRNANIAERLVVSPKTVEHHVSAVLHKHRLRRDPELESHLLVLESLAAVPAAAVRLAPHQKETEAGNGRQQRERRTRSTSPSGAICRGRARRPRQRGCAGRAHVCSIVCSGGPRHRGLSPGPGRPPGGPEKRGWDELGTPILGVPCLSTSIAASEATRSR